MGYRHSVDQILEAAVAIALDSGISAVTYGSVGRRLSVNSRTVVYYYPTKLDLVGAVIGELGGDLVVLLEEAFGSERGNPQELVARAWPVLTTPAADKVFALYFEIIGLASSGQAPYDDLAAELVGGVGRLVGAPSGRQQRSGQAPSRIGDRWSDRRAPLDPPSAGGRSCRCGGPTGGNPSLSERCDQLASGLRSPNHILETQRAVSPTRSAAWGLVSSALPQLRKFEHRHAVRVAYGWQHLSLARTGVEVLTRSGGDGLRFHGSWDAMCQQFWDAC